MDRRQYLSLFGVGATAALAGCSRESPPAELTPSLDTADWPMLGHDPGNTGHNPHASPPGDDPSVAWRVETDARLDYQRNPVVVDGTLVVGGNGLHGFEAETGDELWTRDVGSVYGLAADADTAYAVEGTDAAEHTSISAYALADGTRRWTSPEFSHLDPPVLANDELLVADERDLASVSREDGSVRWSFSPDGRTNLPPVVTSSGIYYAGGPGALSRKDRGRGFLDARLGHPPGTDWTADTSGYWLITRPAVRDGLVTVPFSRFLTREGENDGTLAAYDTDGTERWTHEVGARVSSPAMDGDTVYVLGYPTVGSASGEETAHYSRDAVVYAYDAASGRETWRQTYSGLGNTTVPPVVSGGVAYAGLHRDDGDVTRSLVVAVDGSGERWRYETGSRPSRLFAVGDCLYVALADGALLALV